MTFPSVFPFLYLFLLELFLLTPQARGDLKEREISRVYPLALEALEFLVLGRPPSKISDSGIIFSLADIIQSKNFNQYYLKELLTGLHKNSIIDGNSPYFLPIEKGNEKHSIMKMALDEGNQTWPKLAVHAFKMDIVEEEDDSQGDHLYFYFFSTDGLIPTGKVTDIYKGLGAGDSFFLTPKDRIIYPLSGKTSAVPTNHLIIDYGVVESDGDHISDLQKTTEIIFDMALVVYSATNPSLSPAVLNLRKEVKNLAKALLALDKDDRLITDSIYFEAREMNNRFGPNTFFEIQRVHKGTHLFSNWEYQLHFRFLKERD